MVQREDKDVLSDSPGHRVFMCVCFFMLGHRDNVTLKSESRSVCEFLNV